jgi:hypothetical protein
MTHSPLDPEAVSLFKYVMGWQTDELEYRVSKFPSSERIRLMRDEGIGEGSVWREQVFNKFHRAYILGLDTPNGRQAAAKCAAAALSMTETAVKLYGPLPHGGYPSGDFNQSYPYHYSQTHD